MLHGTNFLTATDKKGNGRNTIAKTMHFIGCRKLTYQKINLSLRLGGRNGPLSSRIRACSVAQLNVTNYNDSVF